MSNRFKFSKEMRAKEKEQEAKGFGLLGCHMTSKTTSFEYMSFIPFTAVTLLNSIVSKIFGGMSVEDAFWKSKPDPEDEERAEDAAKLIFDSLANGVIDDSLEAYDPEGSGEVDITIGKRLYRLHLQDMS